MRAPSSTTQMIILFTPYNTGTLDSFIHSCIQQSKFSLCASHVARSVKCCNGDTNKMLRDFRGGSSELCQEEEGGGDETEKMGRISKGENDVPG